jgi:hypothetical protein
MVKTEIKMTCNVSIEGKIYEKGNKYSFPVDLAKFIVESQRAYFTGKEKNVDADAEAKAKADAEAKAKADAEAS